MSTSLLLWGVLFGSVGFGYFTYGRRQRALVPFLCGVALMVLPYLVARAWLLVVLGVGLGALPFVLRRYF